MTDIKFFDYCPPEAMDIRIAVFVDEQGFCDRLDDTDKAAVHVVAYDGEAPVGTCRIVRSGDEAYFFGRLAVLPSMRGKSIGSGIMSAVEEYVLSHGARRIFLHAQMRAKVFYEKCGFTTFGDVEYEENYPHIWMEKNLLPREHFMNLQPQPFENMARGIKTIELRLDDERRRNVFAGDRITFTHTQSGERLSAEILALHRFPSFSELYSALPLDRCGYTKENIAHAHPSDMDIYYPPERQAQYGVLGIEIRMRDIDMARHNLSGHTICLCRGGKILTDDRRGISPMLELISSGTDLNGYSVADKVVGRAAALLFAKAGICEVYAEVLSKNAAEVLSEHNIPYTYTSLTDSIINRSGTDICPMEKATLGVCDPDEAYRILLLKVEELKKQAH